MDFDEYRGMVEMDVFEGAPVELLDSGIWQEPAPDFYRWTREHYYRLIEAGFFDDGRVELLEGLIWDLAGQMAPHTTGKRLTQLSLEEKFPGAFEVRVQMPVTLPDGTEPEPDVAVAPGTPFDYLEHHPGPDELLLAVEVSDGTLAKVRGLTFAAYAKAGVIECWIVNLVNRQLEVYRRPSAAGHYAEFITYLPGQSAAPLNAPYKPIVQTHSGD